MEQSVAARPFTYRYAIPMSLAIAVVMIGAAFIGYTVYQTTRPVFIGAGGQRIPISQEIEDRYGIRLTFVALTARDGFIDMRYRVIDADKATDFGHYPSTTPMIIAEDSGAEITVTEMGLHNHRMQPGLIFHVMYRNTGNAVMRGRPVTVQVGDMKIEHIIVQ